MMRPIAFLIFLLVFAFAAVECDYSSKKRADHDKKVIDFAVNYALDKPGLREPRLGDLTPKGLKYRMIEDQLRVVRFGRVSHTKDGKTEEYWEAQVVDTESKSIFFIRCDEKTNKHWDDLVKELEEKNFRWKVVPMSKDALLKGWGEAWLVK